MSGFLSYMPTRAATVTPSDSTDLTGCIGLYVGGAGNVAVQMVHGFDGAPPATVTLSAVPAGTILPGNFTRVMAATAATNIVALYA